MYVCLFDMILYYVLSVYVFLFEYVYSIVLYCILVVLCIVCVYACMYVGVFLSLWFPGSRILSVLYCSSMRIMTFVSCSCSVPSSKFVSHQTCNAIECRSPFLVP